ncbi:hypothetical protein [Sphingomonas sp. MMS24-J13]|uniref:hypothetical protein n=1 Tax=Sphingomonas sp. MMS24-J13 TaxID=3238686 RepID=UPI00384B918D
MRKIVIAAAFAAAMLGGAAQAGAPGGSLRFRELEYQQPRDPLTGSNPAYVEIHHASIDQLAGARAAIEAAVPAGADRRGAERLLTLAGARCGAVAADGVETCTYRDVETVDEYLDQVRWTVRMNLAGDKVASIAVDRTWQRD